jgi:hypothetical protein
MKRYEHESFRNEWGDWQCLQCRSLPYPRECVALLRQALDAAEAENEQLRARDIEANDALVAIEKDRDAAIAALKEIFRGRTLNVATGEVTYSDDGTPVSPDAVARIEEFLSRPA